MMFLVDESADARIVAHLIALGYDATLVARNHGPGLADEKVLALAHAEGRVLITDDRDFGELVFRHQRPYAGVIFFRLSTTMLADRIERLNHILTHYADQLDQFIVVTDRRVR